MGKPVPINDFDSEPNKSDLLLLLTNKEEASPFEVPPPNPPCECTTPVPAPVAAADRGLVGKKTEEAVEEEEGVSKSESEEDKVTL